MTKKRNVVSKRKVAMNRRRVKANKSAWALPPDTLRTPTDYDFARIVIDALLDVRAGTAKGDYPAVGASDPASVATIFATVLADMLFNFHQGDVAAAKADWHAGLDEMQVETIEYQNDRLGGDPNSDAAAL